MNLQLLIDSVPALIHTGLPDGYLDFFNQTWLKYVGLSLEDLQGWKWTAAIHPEDVEGIVNKWRASVASGEPFLHEARVRRADGEYRWMLHHKIALRDEHGRIIKWYGSSIDIEDRKRAEEKARQNERDLRTIVETIPAFVGTALPDGSVDFVSQSWLDYTGLSRDQWLGWGWMNVTHPEDVDSAVTKWKAALAAGESIEQEQRIRQADGKYRWFLGRNVPLRDEKGNIVKWYGTLVDIDDRKKAEEKIRQDERELRQLIDVVPQHILVEGKDGSRLYANRGLLEYHGLAMEDVQAADFSARVTHPDDVKTVLGEYQSGISRGVSFQMEARLRRKDGQYRWFLIHYNPARNEQGRITLWYVTATDIDDRKRAEERVQEENIALREEVIRASMLEEIVGTSPALKAVLSRVSKVAPTDSTVLITGETGTGKELIARAVHKRSKRASRAFVSVNCAAIPHDLIASELFGHEKGAFTGATQRHLGRFEMADGGTIFLDEVGELPAETQIALLRVLQEHEFERVGGNLPIRSDVRVIAATNRDLQAAIAAGTFRSDLFYRLNVFPIEIPPLRERREDIPLLVEYFIDRYARKAGKKIRGVNKKSLDLLQSYDWPGNIRELQNVIERSVIVCETENFSVDESWLSRQPPATEQKSPLDLSGKLAAQEKEIIETALRECGGRVFGPSGAAAKLGMPRSTLESKIRSLKINKNRFKTAGSSKGS